MLKMTFLFILITFVTLIVTDFIIFNKLVLLF